MITLDLPWPPTVNHYWIRTRNGHALSKRALGYRASVWVAWKRLRTSTQAGGLWINIVANPPDHRKRDLDNLIKALFDAMQHSGVYKDDCQINEFRIVRDEVVKGGKLCVTIGSSQAPPPLLQVVAWTTPRKG